MTGKLTTHVLDVTIGKPAINVLVELWGEVLVLGNEFIFLQKGYTNEDGRLNKPLLEGSAMRQGVYELRFHVGSYYRNQGHVSDEQFLDCVPVRFTITNLETTYHIPLLVSPGGYTTYRGS